MQYHNKELCWLHTVLPGHTKHIKLILLTCTFNVRIHLAVYGFKSQKKSTLSLINGQELATKSTTHRLGSNKKKISNELIVANLRLLSQNLCQVI